MPIINTMIGGGVNTKDATAVSGNILEGKTAYVNKSKVVGTMPEKAGITVDGTLYGGASNQILTRVEEGHFSPTTQVYVAIANLKPENIRQGIRIGGVTGTCY